MIKNGQIYKTLLEVTSDSLFIINTKGEILEFSSAASTLLGYTRDELSGKTVFDFDKKLSKEKFQNIIANLSDKPVIFERVHTRKDKSTYICEITVTSANFDNEILMFFSVKDITELRKSTAQIKESHKLLKRLSQQVPGALYQFQYFLDGRSAFPYASDGIWDIYEVTPEEVMGDASLAFTRIHPEDYQMLVDSILDSFEHLTTWQCDYRVLLPNKGLRWLRGISNPEKLHDQSVLWHGYLNDITEIKQIELALKDSLSDIESKNEKINNLLKKQKNSLEMQLEKVLDSSLNGVQYFKSIRNEQNEIVDFEYVFSNKVACEIIQKDEDEIIGQRLLEVLPKHTEIIGKYGKSLFEIYCEIVETGESRDLLFSFEDSAINDWFSNKVVKLEDGFVVTFFVITGLIENMKLEKLNIELKKQVEIEVAKNRQKDSTLIQQSKLAAMGEMISAIAHQWRQPLNNIGLSSQLMKDIYLGQPCEIDYMELFRNHTELVQYMSKTIDDFKNYFSVNKEKSEFSIVQQLITTIELTKPQLSSKGVETILHCTCGSHSFSYGKHYTESYCEMGKDIIIGFPSEFKQVVIIIISNASDAIMEYAGTDSSADRTIQIDVNVMADHISVDISNSGNNIPADIMPRIFEPYFTTKDEGKGTGLGLYMSKMIIEKSMNGKLTCRNTENGVCLNIHLPRIT